jgi:hypothetical protein
MKQRKCNKRLAPLIALILVIPTLIILYPVNLVYASLARAEIISYYADMSNVKWSPITYPTPTPPPFPTPTIPPSTYIWNYKYYDAYIYTGIPYGQNRPGVTYDTFLSVADHYNDIAGIGRVYYFYDHEDMYMANDCSSSVARAWLHGGANNINPNTNTTWMIKAATGDYSDVRATGIVKVGNYTATLGDTSEEIVHANTSATMYASYDQLLIGDALVHNGHVMLVTGINTVSNLVNVKEQIGGSDYLALHHTTWRNQTGISYSTLISDHYIPIKASLIGP